jgi:Flp pilus assembly protein CpaB
MGARRGRSPLIIIILLVIILLVGGIAAFVLAPDLFGLGGTTGDGTPDPAVATSPPLPTAPPIVQVIIANRDIARGSRITEDDITTLAWPVLEEAPPPVGALLVSDEEGGPGLEQVQNRIARVDILRGQPVQDFMLTPGSEPVGLADTGSDAALLIPSGQVAIAIPMNRISSVAYAVGSGDHVDLMMSIRFVDVDEDFQTLLPNDILMISDDTEITELGLNFTSSSGGAYGREEDGPFGTTLIIGNNDSDLVQRPRQATQILIDNAIVLQTGNWPLDGLNAPIIITPIATIASPEVAPADGTAEPGQAAAPVPTPTITPVPIPDVVTLAMSRQDALVLKYALETGADIDFALHSILDIDAGPVATETVTLQYIIDFYNLTVPSRLPVAQDPRVGGEPVFPECGNCPAEEAPEEAPAP